jgi:hypothetical protein
MSGTKNDARWSEAAPLTTALWLFMLLIFLPAILARHADGGWLSIALDCATILASIALGLALFPLFRATADWRTPVRILVLTLAVLATAVAQTLADLVYTAWIAENLHDPWRSVPTDLARASAALLNYVCVFTVNVALFQLSYSRRASLTRERALAAAQSAQQQAQLEALRLQLNPHFLFNTLNAISSLILTRRNDDAELMTDKLSSFLRTSLASNPTKLVPVKDELELMSEYLEIESVRFGDRLIVDIGCAEAARELCVPGMLIQPLVENAVKHGVAQSTEPVTITIDAHIDGEVLCLSVANDRAGGEPAPKAVGASVGLSNTRKRLASLYGDRASLTAEPVNGGYLARICIPIPEAAEPTR